MKQGVLPEDVMCKETLELVIRINGLAACVKPETAVKMQKTNMLYKSVKFIDNAVDIETKGPYHFTKVWA